MNPYLTASRAVLEELYDNLTELIRPLDEDCLNWTPLHGETNSITNLTCHIVGSVDSWLSRAVDEPFPRDRDAEFHTRHNAVELVSLIERSRARARDHFARLDGIDGDATRSVRRLTNQDAAPLSAAWCVEHALIHAGEHWGQIQLNHQLYSAEV